MDLEDKEIHSSEGLVVLGSVPATQKKKKNHPPGRHCRTKIHWQYLARVSAFPRSLPKAPSLAFGSHRGRSVAV